MSPNNNVLIIGANSAIAQALVRQFRNDAGCGDIFLVSRSAPPFSNRHDLHYLECDYSESDIRRCTQQLREYSASFSRVFICNGILHADTLTPEKRLEDIHLSSLMQVFQANAFTPILWLQALLPILKGKQPCIVTVFSARIGSIADNRLGGWYSYRGSKAALNMLLQTAAIEYSRRAPQVKLIAFHPGTTDTPLSRPFQSSVPEGKLFTPEFVAQRLIDITGHATPDGILSYLDWAGEAIPW